MKDIFSLFATLFFPGSHLVSISQTPVLKWSFDNYEFGLKGDSFAGSVIFQDGAAGKELVFNGYPAGCLWQ